jgi:hypothetical protein
MNLDELYFHNQELLKIVSSFINSSVLICMHVLKTFQLIEIRFLD